MLAVIGGTGVTSFPGLEVVRKQVVQTPYGLPSSPLIHGLYEDKPVVFLARHGLAHTIPPHQINYRANLWALQHIGVKNIIAIAAVGGINPDLAISSLVLPDQLIDYTCGREHSFFEYPDQAVTHIDFTQPYCPELRQALLNIAKNEPIELYDGGVYGVTQGPRLETAAEIQRMANDGNDIVGMTGMPEASLARELDLCYATCAVIANPAAGLGGTEEISMQEIEACIAKGLGQVQQLLAAYLHMT